MLSVWSNPGQNKNTHIHNFTPSQKYSVKPQYCFITEFVIMNITFVEMRQTFTHFWVESLHKYNKNHYNYNNQMISS